MILASQNGAGIQLKMIEDVLVDSVVLFLSQTREKVEFTEAILHLFLSLSRIPTVWSNCFLPYLSFLNLIPAWKCVIFFLLSTMLVTN